jgi:hypothetical protein
MALRAGSGYSLTQRKHRSPFQGSKLLQFV